MAKLGMHIHSPMGRNKLGSSRFGAVGIAKPAAIKIGSKGGLGKVGTPGTAMGGGRGGYSGASTGGNGGY